MMNPLVDEYNTSTSMKGTQLVALHAAEQKAKAFTKKFFAVSFAFLAIDIVQKIAGL